MTGVFIVVGVILLLVVVAMSKVFKAVLVVDYIYI